MSAHPGVASPRRRSRVTGPVLALCSLLVSAACDQPTQPEVVAPPQFSHFPSTVNCGEFFNTGGNTKSVEITVKRTDNQAAREAIVMLVHPQKGPACWAQTPNNGTVKFTDLSVGASFFATIRHVSWYAPFLEVAPADPNTFAFAQLDANPSAPLQRPTLLSGASCTTNSALTWSAFAAASPCVVPNGGFKFNVTLGGAESRTIRIVGPDGPANFPVLVAAISTTDAISEDASESDIAAAIAEACAKMPWLAATGCTDVDEFGGPGLLQALRVAKAIDGGQTTLGVVSTGGKLYIEATAQGSGFTLFGTTILEPGTGDAELRLEPGMCRTDNVVNDTDQPSENSQLDIDRTVHSIGLGTKAGAKSLISGQVFSEPGLGPMLLVAEPGTIVVKAVIRATMIGGDGQFDLQYGGQSGGNRTVRVRFDIVGNICSKGAVSGSGIGDGVVADFECLQTAESDGTWTEFTMFFTVTSLPAPLARAEYTLKAHMDGLDPSRSDNQTDTPRARGAIQITGLDDTTCPVPTNNDSRFVIM